MVNIGLAIGNLLKTIRMPAANMDCFPDMFVRWHGSYSNYCYVFRVKLPSASFGLVQYVILLY